MKTEYKYIRFVEVPTVGKTKRFECQNIHHGDVLGIIKYYPSWRAYCYFPVVQAVYSTGCMNDIVNFIEQLETERKGKL